MGFQLDGGLWPKRSPKYLTRSVRAVPNKQSLPRAELHTRKFFNGLTSAVLGTCAVSGRCGRGAASPVSGSRSRPKFLAIMVKCGLVKQSMSAVLFRLFMMFGSMVSVSKMDLLFGSSMNFKAPRYLRGGQRERCFFSDACSLLLSANRVTRQPFALVHRATPVNQEIPGSSHPEKR